jgi:predicted phosphodiesterase
VTTLVVSDLHLGSAWDRDVLRRAPALEVLLAAVREADRLVLLGDIVELLEGRPTEAMEDAVPVLREIGAAAGRDTELVIVPGNHDFATVRPWLAARALRRRAVGLAARVGRESSPRLTALTRALRPARPVVRYPGVWLADGLYATHGHYLDRHLTPDFVRRAVRPRFARLVGHVPEEATAEDYERAGGANFAALTALLAADAPAGMGDAIDRVAGRARRAALAAMPHATALLGLAGRSNDTADTLGASLRRAGLAAMGEVVARLGIEADHVVFGHIHRAGPFPDDDADEWVTRTGARLLNSGCWVHEPFLLDGAGPEHPYWPGRAVRLGDDGVPQLVSLLDGVPRAVLAP